MPSPAEETKKKTLGERSSTKSHLINMESCSVCVYAFVFQEPKNERKINFTMVIVISWKREFNKLVNQLFSCNMFAIVYL